MRSAKRTTWAVLMAVVGIGLLAVIGGVAFAFFGKARPVNPGAELSELMNKVDPDLRVGAVGTGPALTPRPPVQAAQPRSVGASAPAGEAGEPAEGDPAMAVANPAVIVLAALPDPTGTANPTTTAPTATAAAEATAPPATTTAALAGDTAGADTAGGDTDIGTATEDSEQAVPQEPPPGAAQGVTYCGAMTCVVGYKCCCDGCVPFDQACNPRSCEAQAGLSISVPCGMDLCDPGEVCCDARCGQCAQAGECPEEPCD